MAADAEATLPALDRGLQARDRRRSPQGASRRAAKRWPTRTARRVDRARAEAAYAWDASPISTARSVGRAVGANQERGLGAGVRERTDSGWSTGCGRSTSTISCSAAPAVRASATARRPPSAPRWRTRSTAGCRSRSRATATSCTRPASGGRRRITRFRCWRSMHNNRAYHQEVMHVQRMANRHNRGITRAPHRHNARQPEHRLREDRRRAWACTRRDRLPIPMIWDRRSSGRSRWSNAASRRSIDVVTQPR